MMKILSKPCDKNIQAILDISRDIANEKYLDDILNLILMVSTNVTHIKICSLWLSNDRNTSKKLCLKASQPININYFQNRSLHFSDGVVGYVATHKRPLIIKNVLNDRQFKEKEMAQKIGLVSMLSIPMIGRDDEKVLGVLNSYTTQPYQFCDTDINLMTAVADNAVTAILDMELMVRNILIQEELDTHRLMKRACKVLIRQREMRPNEAIDWIEKCSYNSCKSIRHVAESILLSA